MSIGLETFPDTIETFPDTNREEFLEKDMIQALSIIMEKPSKSMVKDFILPYDVPSFTDLRMRFKNLCIAHHINY